MAPSTSTTVGSPVGQLFSGSTYRDGLQVFVCESVEIGRGYWMRCVSKPSVTRRNISVRAIGATFHAAADRGDHWLLRGGQRVQKGVPQN